MRLRRDAFFSAGLCVLAIALLSTRSFAETPYFSVTLDQLSVVSNGGAKRCSRIAFQFARFEDVLRDLAGWDSDVTLPALQVFLIAQKDADAVFYTDADRRQESTERKIIYSKYMPGAQFNVAAMVDHGSYEEPMQSLFLLFTQSHLVAGPTRQHPAWYQLGIANLLNGLVIREDGSVILNRELPFAPDLDDSGRQRAKFDLPNLLATTRTRGLTTQSDWKEFILRSRNWAQFGLLTTAAHRTQYCELATLMRQGTPVDEAVSAAFGMPLAQLTAEYEDNRWRKDVQFRLPPPAAPIVVPEPVLLSAEDARKQLQIVAERVGARSDP